MNQKMPRIAIVMPAFNSVDFIERSIKSVISQNYPDYELFIKDGGSKDGTVEIIRYYAKKHPKNIHWISNKDKGQTDAINYGLKRVKGEILTYLNADDTYEPNALKTVGSYFATHQETMWAYGKCRIIDEEDREIRRWITNYKNFWLKNYSYPTLLVLNYISQMACFWRKEAYKSIGELDLKQHYVMDYDYWLRLGKKYKAGVINSYLANFRISKSNKSSLGFVQQFKDDLSVARKYTDNKLIINLHKFHDYLIVSIYSLLRFKANLFAKRSEIKT